jgi:plastocyanin
MRQFALCLLSCLLLTACTAGIVQREVTVPDTPAEQMVSGTSPAPTQTPAATPAPAAAPTSPPPVAVVAPTSAATTEADSEPIIHYFRASVRKATAGDVAVFEDNGSWPPAKGQADPGDTVVFEWETTGAIQATLGIHLSQQVPVDASGTFTYETKPDQCGCVVFSLTATNGEEQADVATIHIQFPCPTSLFFSPGQRPECCGPCANFGCPEPAITSDAAEQHFEHGTMIWVKEQDTIYVLFEDVPSGSERAAKLFTDEWDEGQPDHDPSLVPPDGLYQPVRGFGLVWRQNPEVRERLGWAVDQETAFVTTVQRVPGYGRHSSTYMRALDGNVWHLQSIGFGCGWSKITVD